MNSIAATGALIGFLLPVALLAVLDIPSESDVAKTIVETVQESTEPSSLAHQTAQNAISTLEILGIVLLITTVFIPILKLFGF